MIRIRYLGEDNGVKVLLATNNIIIYHPSKVVVIISNAFWAQPSVNLHLYLHLSFEITGREQ
jgi:hypothetical protein